MKKVLISILIIFAAGWVIAGGAGQGKGAGKEKAEQKTVQTPAQEKAETEKAAEKAADKAETKGAKSKKSADDADKAKEAKKPEESKKPEEAKKAEKIKKAEDEDGQADEGKKEKAKEAKEAEDEVKDDAAKGKGKGQQGAALEKQLAHEEEKHLARQARLEKMLEVAKEKGDDKAVARIQSLMDKEKTRFGKKHTKMTGRAAGTQQEAAETGKKPAPKKEKNND